MKTTLNLDDDLVTAAKQLASARATTFTSVVEDALRQLLNAPAPPPYRFDFPVTQGTRPPSIDIDSNAAIEEYFDRRDWESSSS
jgi:predicted transcriptional regulator